MAADRVTNCSACGASQRAEAAFCDACGTSLVHAPTRLTEQIRAARGHLDGESKQVTVMFVDIVGSMGLSERLGADRWRTLLERFFVLASAAVHSVDGTVDKFTGDGIMAIFGAPVGHEDHARRACLAALQLHAGLAPFAAELRSRELELKVRVGLNSGEVVVGSIGDDLRMDYTAIGHTVGVAARMEPLAPGGSTAISATTEALVRGEFELSVLHEAVDVKGTTGPQLVFELRGPGRARTRLDAQSHAGQLSGFVGRRAERDAIDDALARVLAGEGRVVSIVGEPGMGKSRLVRELSYRCAARDVAVLQARAVAHSRQTPLLPLLDLLRSVFGIGEDDEPTFQRTRIASALMALHPGFEADLPLMWDFLGVPDPERPSAFSDPEARERRLLALITGIVCARSRFAPIVLVLEDLHWLDDASRLFMAELVRATAEARILLVLTYRPEYAGFVARGEHCTLVELEPLDGAEVTEMLTDLLGEDPTLGELPVRVAERAAGNPFFTEELVQALVEEGRLRGPRGRRVLIGDAVHVVLPATVQATIAARIDRLPAPQKELLLVASVIGETTDWRLLNDVGEIGGGDLVDALRGLVASDLLVERLGDERIEYAFRHPLIQEVAYRGQLEDRRRRLHGRAADAIAALHAERIEERAALMAHHSEHAGRTADAAQWHARAATWAGQTTSNEAMRHWQAARRLADLLPAGPERNGLGVGARLGVLSQAWRLKIAPGDIDDTYEETVRLLDGDEGFVRVLLDFAYSANLGFGGHLGRGLEVARVNTRRAWTLGDPGLIVLAAGAHWYGALTAGAVREGLEVTAAALERAGGDTTTGGALGAGVDHPYALVLCGHGYCAAFLGDVAEGMAHITEAADLARAAGTNSEIEPCALSELAFLKAMTGDPDGALDAARTGLAAAERNGNGFAQSASWLGLVWAALAAEDWDTATAAAHEMLDIRRSRGIGFELETFAHGALADAALADGRPADAVALARRSIAVSLDPSPTWCELVGQLRLARSLVALHGPAALPEAEVALARAAHLADLHGIVICDPMRHRTAAILARARGDVAGAERHEQAAESRRSALVAG